MYYVVKKSKTSTKDKHFGNKEQYSYFWLLKKFEKLIESMNWIRNTGSWKAIPYLILQKICSIKRTVHGVSPVK
jgi:hypothetical protein